MYNVGKSEEISQFLKYQHPPQPPITKEHWEQIKSQTEANVNTKTVEDFQRMGMFEMFGNISPQQRTEQIKLVHWLDQQVSELLLRQYIEEAKGGNYNAIFALKQLQSRIDAAKKSS